VYNFDREVKSGGQNLSDISPPRRAPDEALDNCIAKAFKENPDLSTRKIARALRISSATVRKHLTKSLGMKCHHMRWAPRTSIAKQKAKRVEMAGSMVQKLESHAA
jgi:DNA invertase Pin-like site-specific DNA recombinase